MSIFANEIVDFIETGSSICLKEKEDYRFEYDVVTYFPITKMYLSKEFPNKTIGFVGSTQKVFDFSKFMLYIAQKQEYMYAD